MQINTKEDAYKILLDALNGLEFPGGINGSMNIWVEEEDRWEMWRHNRNDPLYREYLKEMLLCGPESIGIRFREYNYLFYHHEDLSNSRNGKYYCLQIEFWLYMGSKRKLCGAYVREGI